MKVINKIMVSEDKSIGTKRIGSTVYYVCSVCGRLSFRKIVSYHKIYCCKHYDQIKKYGHSIDDNPRTLYDRNEIRVDQDTAHMDLYNKNGIKIAETVFDAKDVEKVRYIKWKLSGSGYVMNAPKFKGGNIHFTHIILNTDQFVDHIDHDPLNNKKSNLRILTRSQNQMNVNYRGVKKLKNGKYMAHIKLNQKMYNLGVYVFEEEALYARWYAETLLFGEYRYPKEKPVILKDRETDIQEYVKRKVQRV